MSRASEGGHHKVVVIGDTEGDVKAGFSSSAVTYLFKQEVTQEGTKAHHVISDLRVVLKELD